MRRQLLRTAVLVASALLAPPLARAGDDPTHSSLASAYPAPSIHGKLELSLADAIAMGLENNLNVEIARHDPLISYETSRLAWAPYDPQWFTEFGYADDRIPSANALATGSFGADGGVVGVTVEEVQQETLGGQGGIRALLPWLNTQLSATLDTREFNTSTPFYALLPEYDTGLTFVARQPLLRGLIWNESWTNVKTSQIAYQGSLDEFRRNVMDTVQAIENAYWALIADDERVRVAEKSLETAQALLDQVKTQFEVGVVSKVEIAEAEAGVANREFELIRAQNVYQTSMDNAIDLILGTNLTADSRIQIEPTDRPDEYVAYDIDVRRAFEIALKERPELALAQKDIDRLEINLKFAKNTRLPQLDIEGRYGHQGLSGHPRDKFVEVENPSPPPPTQLVGPIPSLGSWSKSFEPLTNSYGIRGILTIPLGNVEGRHSVSMAQLELRRANVAKRRVEQNIVLEVRKAARDITSAQEGIESAERGRAAAREQLRAERIRLEYGESTPFDVLQREEDLVTAEQQYIGAFQVYRDAVTGLDRAQGTILRNRNVNVEAVSRLR
jgi:outer membrane protein TolC